MGVDHRRAHVFVAQELLYGPDIAAIFQQAWLGVGLGLGSDIGNFIGNDSL